MKEVRLAARCLRAEKAFAVRDLAEFLAAPVLPAKTAAWSTCLSTGPRWRGCASGGSTTFTLKGRDVILSVLQAAPDSDEPQPLVLNRAYVLPGKYSRYSLDDVRRDAMDFGTHLVDQALVLSRPVERVYAEMQSRDGGERSEDGLDEDV